MLLTKHYQHVIVRVYMFGLRQHNARGRIINPSSRTQGLRRAHSFSLLFLGALYFCDAGGVIFLVQRAPTRSPVIFVMIDVGLPQPQPQRPLLFSHNPKNYQVVLYTCAQPCSSFSSSVSFSSSCSSSLPLPPVLLLSSVPSSCWRILIIVRCILPSG